MAYILPIIALYVVSLIAAVFAAPSPDPYTIYLYQTGIVAILLATYFLGYRRGKSAEERQPGEIGTADER